MLLGPQVTPVQANDFARNVELQTQRGLGVRYPREVVGGQVTVDVWGVGPVRGRLTSSGVDWLLLEEPTGAEVLVSGDAVTSVRGLTAWSREPGSDGVVTGKLDLCYALRGVARNRAGVTAVLRDATVVSGTIDRVGFDFLELAEHPMGEPRRASVVQGTRAVRLASLALLRSW